MGSTRALSSVLAVLAEDLMDQMVPLVVAGAVVAHMLGPTSYSSHPEALSLFR